MNIKKKNPVYQNWLNENIMEFKMRSFMDVQKEIYEKFRFEAEGHEINTIDKYILQTIEEIYEVDSSSTPSHQCSEIIDILMYLGSLYWCVEEFCIVSIRNERKVISFPKQYFNVKDGSENYDNSLVDVDGISKKVLTGLVSIRRLFPERKWHKEHKYLEPQQVKDRQNYALETITILIREVFEFLIKNFSPEYVDRNIITKQKLIKGE
jgi:hypothetical protein